MPRMDLPLAPLRPRVLKTGVESFKGQSPHDSRRPCPLLGSTPYKSANDWRQAAPLANRNYNPPRPLANGIAVSNTHPSPSSGWDQVKDLLGEYRAEGERMLAFLGPQIDQLESLRAQLDERERELTAHAEQLSRERDELQELRNTGAAWHDEKRRLQSELDQARERLHELASVAVEAEELRSALVQARSHVEVETAGAAGEEGPSRDQLHALELERARLEWELETVRNRAAELAENAAQEKRRVAEERAEWSGQLKQLRSALEQQAHILANHRPGVETSSPPQLAHAAQSAPAAANEARVTAPATPQGSDPVLQSIMSQFEMLQKDLVRRRTGQTGATRKEGPADPRRTHAVR